MKNTLLAGMLLGSAFTTAQAEVVHVNSTDCSFYITEVQNVSQSRYGASSNSFIFNVKLPDEAINFGMYVRYRNVDKEEQKTLFAP